MPTCECCGFRADAGLSFESACPSCGAPIRAGAGDARGFGFATGPGDEPSGRSSAALRAFRDAVRKLRDLFVRPSIFFRTLPRSEPVSTALAFALGIHWLTAGVQAVWAWAFRWESVSAMKRLLEQLSSFSHSEDWGETFSYLEDPARWNAPFALVGRFLADPFVTLAALALGAAWIYVGAALLAPENKNDYKTAVRVVCYASAPTILGILPFGGSFLAWLGGLVLLVIGIRETYRVGDLRALVIAVFPKLILAAVVFLGVFFFAAFIVQVLAALAIF